MDAVAPVVPMPASALEPQAHAAKRWSFGQRALFRFVFVYLVLYCWPENGRLSLVDALPVSSEYLTSIAQKPLHALTPWIASHVFHLSGPVTQYHPTGSGDTTLDYIAACCFFAIAVIATMVWSMLDRHRGEYRTLYAWLRLLVRFTLAFAMLAYGFAKVFPLQFGSPSLSTLAESYGESSPMRLLWTFMAASKPYTMFCGSVEATAGMLLLFRRTTTLGALVAVLATGNIVLLNFCYDVPVKLYSSHLLLMALFLLLPDFRSLWNYFVLHVPSKPEGVWIPPFERKWLRWAAVVLQILVVVSLLFSNIWSAIQATTEIEAQSKHPLLYGIWKVDHLAAGQQAQWSRVIWDVYSMTITTPDESLRLFTTYDGAKHSLKLQDRAKKHSGELTYKQPDPQHLILDGKFDGAQVVAQLHRSPSDNFLLTSRGFHWINEDPFNR